MSFRNGSYQGRGTDLLGDAAHGSRQGPPGRGTRGPLSLLCAKGSSGPAFAVPAGFQGRGLRVRWAQRLRPEPCGSCPGQRGEHRLRHRVLSVALPHDAREMSLPLSRFAPRGWSVGADRGHGPVQSDSGS